MALTDDQLSSLTRKHIRPRIYNNFFDANPLLSRLMARNMMQVFFGTKLHEPLIRQGTGQASGFVGDGPLPTTSQEHTTSATFDYVSYESPIVVPWRQLKDNAGPEGVHKILSVIERVAQLDLDDLIGGDIFSGNGTSVDPLALDGLDLMVDDDDAPKSYGGISVSDFAGWAADDAAAFGAITLLKLQGVIGDVTFGLDRPTMILGTQDAFDKVWSLLQADQRFAQVKDADAGFQTLWVSGVPLFVDRNVTAATPGSDESMYFLNENYINWYAHPEANMMMTDFVRPANSLSRIAHIINMIQMTTGRRKAHARRTGVDPSA